MSINQVRAYRAAGIIISAWLMTHRMSAFFGPPLLDGNCTAQGSAWKKVFAATGGKIVEEKSFRAAKWARTQTRADMKLWLKPFETATTSLTIAVFASIDGSEQVPLTSKTRAAILSLWQGEKEEEK